MEEGGHEGSYGSRSLVCIQQPKEGMGRSAVSMTTSSPEYVDTFWPSGYVPQPVDARTLLGERHVPRYLQKGKGGVAVWGGSAGVVLVASCSDTLQTCNY